MKGCEFHFFRKFMMLENVNKMKKCEFERTNIIEYDWQTYIWFKLELEKVFLICGDAVFSFSNMGSRSQKVRNNSCQKFREIKFYKLIYIHTVDFTKYSSSHHSVEITKIHFHEFFTKISWNQHLYSVLIHHTANWFTN